MTAITLKESCLWSSHFESLESILIRAGDGDEALFYQASLGSMIGPQAYLAYFHPTSLMWERVHLFGEIKVMIELTGEEMFIGMLKPCEQSFPVSDKRSVLRLELYEKVLVEPGLEQCIYPIT